MEGPPSGAPGGGFGTPGPHHGVHRELGEVTFQCELAAMSDGASAPGFMRHTQVSRPKRSSRHERSYTCSEGGTAMRGPKEGSMSHRTCIIQPDDGGKWKWKQTQVDSRGCWYIGYDY